MSSLTRIALAIERIRSSRNFTQEFLQDLTPAEWCWTPPQVATHIAWQVGHLAVAQYNLCLRRIRGRTTEDHALISDAFIDSFKGGSKPSADMALGPPLDEIKRVFEAVHQRALSELTGRSDAELDEALAEPHPRFKTKLAAIEYSPHHEAVHAGQIALLRRLMGKQPLR
jgi:DinB family protein